MATDHDDKGHPNADGASREPRKLDRRDVLKGLSTVPALGLFGYAWNAQFMDYGPCGHINADSGLASWPEGHVLLQDLMKD